jgi:drug/metabolite transporter (DMT)-like permease
MTKALSLAEIASPLSPPRPGAAGVPFLIAGIAVFSVQDLILKILSGSYPLYEAMILRSLTAAPLLLALAHLNGGIGTLWTPAWRRMLLRGFLLFVSYAAFYLAIASLPLATTVALFFTAPLFITVLSVPMLGEKVGPRRWFAVLVGFAGVLVMVRPGSDVFDWAAILALVAGLSYAVSMVTARSMGSTETAPALAFWGNVAFLACALALAAVFASGDYAGESHPSLGFLTRAWVTPSLRDLGLMMLCGFIAAAGLTLLTQAYRLSPSSVVAPFEYSAMIWGVLWGWLFWRQLPDTEGWTGILIIVGAGLYVLYREGRQKD